MKLRRLPDFIYLAFCIVIVATAYDNTQVRDLLDASTPALLHNIARLIFLLIVTILVLLSAIIYRQK